VKVLIDTHVFLWANAEPERLGGRRELVADDRTELLWSAASTWEIAIKAGIGRLRLPEPVERYVPDRMRRLGVTPVPIDHRHAAAVAELPRIHGDPFDRMLVAQAQALGVPILTADEAIARYDVEVLSIP
jgi:PIN domain nuclease of toxin-antitoxin system